LCQYHVLMDFPYTLIHSVTSVYVKFLFRLAHVFWLCSVPLVHFCLCAHNCDMLFHHSHRIF
jgi:hypothetical protein